MTPDKLFHELKELAERLGVQVTEQNFRNTGIRVKSGYCKVKGIDYCIIDKHLKLNKKIDILGECVALFDIDSIFVVPVVREFLEAYKPSKGSTQTQAPESFS